MKEEYRPQPADPARGLRAGAAHRLRERRQPAARARGRAPRRRRPCGWRLARRAGRSSTQALVESVLLAVAGGVAGLSSPSGRSAAAARAGVQQAQFLPISTTPSPLVAGVRLRPGAADRHRLRCGAGLAGDAHESGRCAARIRPQHQRSLVVRADRAADRAGDAVGRAGRRRDDAGAQPEQARTPGLRLSRCRDASWCR